MEMQPNVVSIGFLLLLLVPVGLTQSDDGYEAERPNVAWVPIVKREKSKNISADELVETISQAASEEKLARIGKMLNESYDKMNRDTVEGDRIREKMVDRTNMSPVSLLAPIIPACLLFFRR